MKKDITIIEDAVNADILDQAVKVLQAIADQYDHRFSFYKQTATEWQMKEPATGLSRAAGPVLAAGYYHATANGASRKVLAVLHSVTVYSSLQYLSPLKPKLVDGFDLALYNCAIDNISDTAAGHQLADRIAEQARSRKKSITLTGSENEAPDNFLYRQLKQRCGKGTGLHCLYLPYKEAVAQVILNPGQFDVLVTQQPEGDILVTAATTLTGATGMLPAIAATEEGTIYTTTAGYHGQKGVRLENPIGMILAVAHMLDAFALTEECNVIKSAVQWTLLHGLVTKDIDAVNNYTISTIGDLVSDFISGTIPGFSKGENLQLHRSTII